jgi:putative MATE family efflux protein
MTAPPGRLTEGPVGRHLVTMTLPMIWGILAIMTFNLADTFFVGQLGVRELAAMSFTFPVVMLLTSLTIGLGAGTSSVVARAIGEGDRRRVRRLTTDSLILSFLVVAVVSTAGIATIDPLFRLLGAGDELLPLIADYMRIWYIGIAFLVVPMVGMSAIRATGDAKLPSLVMIGAALANILLDPLLIFGLFGLPRLELEGAALASVIARAMTLVIAIYVLHGRLRMLSFARPRARVLLASWRRLLHVGLPAAGTNMIIPLANGVVVAMIAGFGPDAVAGFGVATRIEAMTLVVFYAMSSIIGPFVGQNLGAGQLPRIHAAMRLSVIFCLMFGAVIAVLLGFTGEGLSRLFNAEPTVVAAAGAYLLIVPASYGAAGVVMIANAAFNGIGQPLPAVVVSLARMALLYLPAAYLGAQFIGLEGIFAAACFANLAAGLLAYTWNRRRCRAPLPGTDRPPPPEPEMPQ